MTGRENNPDARPALANTARESHAVEGARHFDVRKHDAHLWGRLKNPQRFVGVARLEHLEAGLGEKVRARQTHQGLVLDDQDDMAGLCGFCLHPLVTVEFDVSSLGFSD
jgi:hypothetical protein